MPDLLPRLSELGVDALLSDAEKLTPAKSIAALDEHGQFLEYAATGGSPRPETALAIAEELRSIAGNLGFPDNSTKTAHSKFDAEAARFLAEHQTLGSGESLRNDVWACLATILAPDVAKWRFPKTPNERFKGGVRNVFQRLWQRGVTLDRGEEHADRWRLLSELTEDAMVAIFERTAIASNRRLALATAEAWVNTADHAGKATMEPIMREAIKQIRIRNVIIDLTLLEGAQLETTITDLFTEAGLEHFKVPDRSRTR